MVRLGLTRINLRKKGKCWTKKKWQDPPPKKPNLIESNLKKTIYSRWTVYESHVHKKHDFSSDPSTVH